MHRFRFLLLLLTTVTATANTLRVPADHPDLPAAIAAAGEGDHILVAPGTYRGHFRLKPGLVLKSEPGAEARTILDGGGDASAPVVTMAEGAALEGFTVTGAGHYDDTLWQQQWDARGSGQQHSDTGTFGVPAIAADGVSCRIARCLVHHNGHTGIALRGRKDTTVHAIVTGCRCWRNMGGGIGLMDGAGGIVQDNECYGNFLAGIGHSGNTAPLVTGNHCHHNVRAGIGVSEGACPIVRANRCHQNRRAGIGIRSGAATRPVVEDNDCTANGMAGIGVDEHAEPILRGNRCTKNELAGIGADGRARLLAVANQCRENAAAGIGLSPGCEAILWQNICEANTTVAIGLPENARAIIAENTLSRTGGAPPLLAIKGGSQAIVANNTLTGGGVAGILLEGRAILTGNTLTGTGGQGLWLWKGSEAIGADNTVRGFKTPLKDDGAHWTGQRPRRNAE